VVKELNKKRVKDIKINIPSLSAVTQNTRAASRSAHTLVWSLHRMGARTARSSDQRSRFVYRRSRVQISVRRPAVLRFVIIFLGPSRKTQEWFCSEYCFIHVLMIIIRFSCSFKYLIGKVTMFLILHVEIILDTMLSI
jgi:hypothetical protein